MLFHRTPPPPMLAEVLHLNLCFTAATLRGRWEHCSTAMYYVSLWHWWITSCRTTNNFGSQKVGQLGIMSNKPSPGKAFWSLLDPTQVHYISSHLFHMLHNRTNEEAALANTHTKNTRDKNWRIRLRRRDVSHGHFRYFSQISRTEGN